MTKKEEIFELYMEKYARAHEGTELGVYPDNNGVPTIGIGFAMIHYDKDEKKWYVPKKEFFMQHEINLISQDRDMLISYADAKNKGKHKGLSEDKLKSLLKDMKLQLKDTAEASKILSHSVEEAYGKVINAIGHKTWDGLSDVRKTAILDECFQRGGIKHIKAPLVAGDFEKAANIMRDVGGVAWKTRAESRADHLQYNKMEFDGVHVVKPGDSFSKIAIAKGLTIEELKNLNPEITNINKLSKGQKIVTKATILSDNSDIPSFWKVLGGLFMGSEAHAAEPDRKQSISSGYDVISRLFNPFTEHVATLKPKPAKEYVVRPVGDTLYEIARDHGTTEAELLKVPGNEYLATQKIVSDHGREIVKLQPGQKVHIPAEFKYSPQSWWMKSDYGSKIETTTGSYNFLSSFNQGNHESIYSFTKNVHQPFKAWSNGLEQNAAFLAKIAA